MEDDVICDNDILVVVAIFDTSIPCGTFLKAKVDKILLTRINIKSPMNIILCSLQGNIHRTTQVSVYSSIVSMRSKVSDSPPLNSSIC